MTKKLIYFADKLKLPPEILTMYKKSSVDTFIKNLRQAGLIVEGTGLFRPGDVAWELFPNYEPLPEGKELVEHWKENLPQGERVIFEHLLQAPRTFVPRSKLQEATGYAKSSIDTYLKFMRARNLIEDRGSIRIHPDFWEQL